MLKGHNLIGFEESTDGNEFQFSFSPVTKNNLPEKFFLATSNEVSLAVNKASSAFFIYKNKTAEERAIFLETIADEILLLGDELIERAIVETGLPKPRLAGERGRTIGQLKLFAEVLREGSWVEAVIDTALPHREPFPRPDLRKILVPIGPVAVFGASNFPFAFSTAGGDTASALAAGNPVIIKAHDSHLGTNELVASAIINAVKKCGMPEGVFSYIIGTGSVTGLQLVKHEGVKAVGFTGSYNAGMSIFKAASNDRKTPIPVFAEMSSINPVLILPEKIKIDKNLPAQIASSINLGAGQFCTNPGILFLLKNEVSEAFISRLAEAISSSTSGTMLNPNIWCNYYKGREFISQQRGINILYEGKHDKENFDATPFLALVSGDDFIINADLQNEVFGPSSLIVLCKDKEEILMALQSLHGQLTATIHGTSTDLNNFEDCIQMLSGKVGRLLFNGVPTGVEFSYAMVHGGPFPATTNANSTSVGADAIKRFVRPICFQDCPGDLLPEALKNNNSLNIMRKINGRFTKDSCN